MNTLCKITTLVIAIPAVVALQDVSAAADDVPRSIAPYFTPATSSPKAPDADGFLQRWLLLEPITKPNRTNTVFTELCPERLQHRVLPQPVHGGSQGRR